MTVPAIEAKIETVLATVQKPSRYIGGEANEVVKPVAAVRVALYYPDAYEIGISNQALQILYALVNGRADAAAERVYTSWPDMADAMRREDIPLFTLETWRPVRDYGRQLRLSLHDVCTSMLEGALGRGDRQTADIIETAWRGGARYDAWSERHVEDIWRRAFAAHDRSIEDEATRERDALEPLPWDHVRSGVTKEFLLDEWWASRAGRATGDCRFDGCTDCGACSGPVRNRLVS